MASVLKTTSIGEALARPSNAFSVLRLALAVAVVVSHSFSVGSGDIPIQQGLHALWPAVSPEMLLLPALLFTAGVAALSWKGIEEPGLRLKAHALRRSAKDSPEDGGPDPARTGP